MDNPCQYAWLYENHRADVSRAISEANQGKVRTQELRDAMSIRMAGFMSWKNVETGEIQHALSGTLSYPWVHICTGNTHSQETKDKIGNAQKGKTMAT